MGQAGPAHNW